MSARIRYGQIKVGSTVCADYEWKHAIGEFLKLINFSTNFPTREKQNFEINFGELVLVLHQRSKTFFAYLNIESELNNLPTYVSTNSVIAIHGQDYVLEAFARFIMRDSIEQLCIQLPCRGWIWFNKNGQRDPLETYWANIPTFEQLAKELPEFRKVKLSV